MNIDAIKNLDCFQYLCNTNKLTLGELRKSKKKKELTLCGESQT